MTPLEFNTLRLALGFTHQALADHFDVALRTAQRWCQPHGQHTPPDRVADELQAMLGDWADRIGELLDAADQLEEDDPVLLFSYSDELECQTYTGLNLAQHTALLGHYAMALTAEEYEWEIKPKP